MRLTKLLFLGVSICLCGTLSTAHAQVQDDVLLFDDPNSSFLLPSYFEQSAPTMPQFSGYTQNTTQNVPADVDILREIFGDQARPIGSTLNEQTPPPSEERSAAPRKTASKTFFPQTSNKQQEVSEGPLLTPLMPLPEVPEKVSLLTPIVHAKSSPYAARLLAREAGTGDPELEVPNDLRLRFPHNTTKLTDAAIKWLTAFAMNVQKDPSRILQIRVSRQNWKVQQARLTLMIQLLMEKGLGASQIKIYQSDRDPETIVVARMPDPTQTQARVPEYGVKKIMEQKTLSW